MSASDAAGTCYTRWCFCHGPVGLIVVNVVVFLHQLLLPDVGRELFVGVIVLYPQSRVLTAIFLVLFFDLVEIPALFFLGIWFLLQLVSGVGSLGLSNAAGGGTAFWAHIGGFVIGVAVGAVLRGRDRRWETPLR